MLTDMAESEILLACPFCGGTAEMCEKSNGCAARCMKCFTRCEWHTSVGAARLAWNRRAGAPKPGTTDGSRLGAVSWLDALVKNWERELNEIPLDTTTGRESYDRLNQCILDLRKASRGHTSASNMGDKPPL